MLSDNLPPPPPELPPYPPELPPYPPPDDPPPYPPKFKKDISIQVRAREINLILKTNFVEKIY